MGQFSASTCENPQTIYFLCKHGHVVVREVACHARFELDCPYCALKWRKQVIKRYSKLISEMLKPKLVSLTLKKPSRHKFPDLSKLVHRFRKYLRRKGYKIIRFVSCLDPPNHIHCVWDSGYIPQRELSKVWKDITADSFIVDIRMVDRHRWRGAARYISKYITKITKKWGGGDLRGVHVIGSWGGSGSKSVRMICKKCGSYFEVLWDISVAVAEFGKLEHVEVDYG